MEALSGLGFYRFSAAGRCYGLLIRVQGRTYVIGATRRGIFYRFGAKMFQPARGYWDSIFGLRTKIGAIELMIGIGLKDEVLAVRFRPNWIHGALHISRTGIINFVVTAFDASRIDKGVSNAYQSVTGDVLQDSSLYEYGDKE